MPARLVQVTLINKSSFPAIWQDDGRPHGFWQEPWYPSNLQPLKPGHQGTWRLESGGIMTGVEGWAYFKVPVPINSAPENAEYFTLWFERPYYGVFSKRIERPPASSYQPYGVAIMDVGFRNLGGGDDLLELVPMSAFVPGTVPLVLANDAIGFHIWWIVEIRDAGERIPGRVASNLVAGNEFAIAIDIDSSSASVWAAIIRPELTVKYWHDRRVESDWNVGSPVRFYVGETDRLAESGTVIELIPNRRLVFSLRSEPGDKDRTDSRVSFTIEPRGGAVRLSLVHDQLADQRAAKEFHDAWRAILLSMKTTLESQERGRTTG